MKMDVKNKVVKRYLKSIKEEIEKHGYIISDEEYKYVLEKYTNSSLEFPRIKKEIEVLVESKIMFLKEQRAIEQLKQLNIKEFENFLLVTKSINEQGQEKLKSIQIKVLDEKSIGHNAPIKIKYGEKTGFYKNSAKTSSTTLDKLEYIISQIGNSLGVKMANTNMLYLGDMYLGIISENVCHENEKLVMLSDIKELIDMNNPQINQIIENIYLLRNQSNYLTFKPDENTYHVPIVRGEEEIKLVIDSFIGIVNCLNISAENKQVLRKDYFNMIMLDYLVGNVDRNMNNYGLIVSEKGEISFSPLFDNSTIEIPSMPKEYQQVNGFLIDRKEFLECLFKNYRSDIKDFTDKCYSESATLETLTSALCQKELTESEKEWFYIQKFIPNLTELNKKTFEKRQEEALARSGITDLETITPTAPANGTGYQESYINKSSQKLIEEGPKLVRKLPEHKPNNNDGKINLVLIISIALIIIWLSILGIYFFR